MQEGAGGGGGRQEEEEVGGGGGGGRRRWEEEVGGGGSRGRVNGKLKLIGLCSSLSAKEVMEATNNFFEARVAVLGYKCRVLQLEGLLEASREENRRLVGEVQRLNGQLQGWNAGLYRPEVRVCV